jgi:hypothetical protein
MHNAEYLTTTISTCAECGRLLPARILLADGAVWFDKHCPQHGPQRSRIYSDAAQYLDLFRFHRAGSMPLKFAASPSNGCPHSCGLCPNHEQHVCMPILEITDHCDLACPICLVRNRATFHLDRPQVAGILDGLIESEGQIDVLSLSGGEPTLNPHFRQIVDECTSRKQILYVSLSTNGRRLLNDESLLRFLIDRRVIISLQFDGLDGQPYLALRGQNLLPEKLRLIDLASRLAARMSLTMTVARGINDAQCPQVLQLLFDRDNILSAMFQPAAYVGRGAAMPRPPDPLTIPDILRALHGACAGQVSSADFSPLPCSHPACFALAFYLRVADGQFVPIRRLVDTNRYLDIAQNRALFGTDADSFAAIKDAIYDLWSGPAALAPDSQKAIAAVKRLLTSIASAGAYCPGKAAALAERSIKSVFIHHFMDRHTFDLSRARKCCQVYPQPDGRLIPACVYNCLRRP